MALELRELRDDVLGALSAPVLPTDQQIASSIFASLPDYYSATRYLPLVLANDTLGAYEVVYVTSHATGVNTATVQRGREGTQPLDWQVGDAIRMAPTWRDVGAPMVFSIGADVPADLAVGARHVVASEGVVRERTFSQGSIPTVRAAPDDLGTAMHTTERASEDKALRVKVCNAVMVTNSGGYVDYYWGGDDFSMILNCIPTLIMAGSSAAAAGGATQVKANLVDTGGGGVSLRFMWTDTNVGAVLANTQVHFGLVVFGV